MRVLNTLFLSLVVLLASLLSLPEVASATDGSKSTPVEQSDKPADTTGETTLRVNINTASASELRALPGIGPSRADAIIQLREKRKQFRKVYELLRVKGIGRKTLKRLVPFITLTEQTVIPATKGTSRTKKR